MLKTLIFRALLVVVLFVVIRRKRSRNPMLKLGDPIPNVTAITQDGNTVKLAVEHERGYLLVYFYPKALTPGCTAQACSLRDAYAELTTAGTTIYGVSLDNAATQKRFRVKEHLPFSLIADTDRKVSSAFGVPVTLNLFAARQAYLFKEGRLVWLDVHASTSQQAKDVLAVMKRPASARVRF
jgi:thioredoxin-dependent peroxiredoxin